MTTLLNLIAFGVNNAKQLLIATLYLDICIALMLMEVSNTIPW